MDVFDYGGATSLVCLAEGAGGATAMNFTPSLIDMVGSNGKIPLSAFSGRVLSL